MFYKVDGQILQAVLNYLAKQPYDGVHRLISALQQSQPIEDTLDTTKEVEDGKIDGSKTEEDTK